MIYGAEAWTLDKETRRALNGANSKMVSAITGRTPHEEATVGKTYDIVAGIRATRLRWLGKILLMNEGRMLQRAVKTLYENPKEGDLLMDAPKTATWEELQKRAEDKKEWALAVRAIKDEIYIRKQGKRKGKKKGRIKKKKKKKVAAAAVGESASSSKSGGRGETRAGEDGDSENEDDSSSDGRWLPRNRAPRNPIRPPIRCYDNFRMSVQASREHYCTPRDDNGPYSAVEVGYPSELEELLTQYADGAGMAGMRPTLYVNVPAAVIQAVVEAHGGIASGRLPPLTTSTASLSAAAASAATATPHSPPSPEPPKVDSDGIEWAVACQPPSDSESETESEVDEMRSSPSSAVHLGAIPPPPPLIEVTMSPIERIQENF